MFQNSIIPFICSPSRYPYSPAQRCITARAYSRLSLAMKLALILAGQTASHSYVLVQLPNPSASIAETIRSTRLYSFRMTLRQER